MTDFAKARRESMRWTILLTLNHARPLGAHETMVLTTVQGVYPDTTPHEIRRELGYLETREMLKIERDPAGAWRSELTRLGIDLVEYAIDCEPGIARPAKYWEG